MHPVHVRATTLHTIQQLRSEKFICTIYYNIKSKIDTGLVEVPSVTVSDHICHVLLNTYECHTDMHGVPQSMYAVLGQSKGLMFS